MRKQLKLLLVNLTFVYFNIIIQNVYFGMSALFILMNIVNLQPNQTAWSKCLSICCLDGSNSFLKKNAI